MRDLTLNEVEQVNGGSLLGDLVTYASAATVGAAAGLYFSNALGQVTLGSFVVGAPAVITSAAFLATPVPPVAFVAACTIASLVFANYMIS